MSLTETAAYGDRSQWGGRAKAGGVGRRMKTRRPGGGEEAGRRQRALRRKVPEQEERMVEKAREALPLAACTLTWENAEISAAPEQGLHANFVDISSVLKKKKETQGGVFQEEGSAETKARSWRKGTVMWAGGTAELGWCFMRRQVWMSRGEPGWSRAWSGERHAFQP